MTNLIIKEFTIAHYEAANVLWYSTEGVCNCDKCMRLDSKENIGKYLKRNPGMSFVAVDSDSVVGTILCGHDGRTGLIYRLTVLPELHRKGVGKELVARSLEVLKKEGITAVKAFVLSDNEKGNAFWEKIGFKEFDIAVTRAKSIRLDK